MIISHETNASEQGLTPYPIPAPPPTEIKAKCPLTHGYLILKAAIAAG